MVELLNVRNLLKKTVREFFYSLNYIEVDTPILSPYENPDDNVENVESSFKDFSGKTYSWFLHTSPEFFMKRFLLNGAERIFQICKVFRNGEVTNLHSVEFTMVEWYRVGESYRVGIEETVSLIRECGRALKRETGVFKGAKTDLNETELITVDEAFREFVGVSVFDREGVRELSGEKSYETAFFKLLVEKVEPGIEKIGKIVVLYDYPKEFGAFSKVRGDVAERFEVYISGVEIANGYTELTSFEEYKEKFEGRNVDSKFLKALKEKPLPRCEGVALGFDRLLMVLTGADSIEEVIPYSTNCLIRETSL
ncbi:lysyl-tRNA synthetase, class 2 [Balnearium lithotrophicum]|uniref:Lysyl-tRNA synthetase, class 2 n=1 Tax=Balnearium lithotrophicum TaxID=223788 RepID=A0A521B9W2_9BACT|nr:amino acid--tRNA ligase-related protein [Balnearium lithotrophicum]SMO43811.1 lysyl-tRNA synthetase, class 2 [Balnearium lithotrophicum]